ncbi:MAG: DNA polymerase III subunit beta [Candidatus Nomurabacteria bacterium]|jgi:DNA polymerase-3 subunit beta|nr:DNA polymerase III subunit beta [Candidatus Nomurabacteria bacterium]
MEIEITQERLSKALNIVSRVAATTKTGLPILNNVLLRADGNQLSLTATNLELATVDYLAAKIQKSGTITVPAKLLAEFISNLPKNTTINLLAKDGKLVTTAGKYKSTINGIAADDFPELPRIEEKNAVTFKVESSSFHSAITEVIVTSSNDTTRPALTGVYFNTFEKSLYIAATDGYRLSEKKFIEDVTSDVFAVVPTSSLQEVLRSVSDDIDDIEMLFDETQVRFRMGEIEITSKLIDGSFPDYRQLIPKKTDINIELNKAEFTRMTKVAALFARESGGSVICETRADDKTFSISAVASELGENSSAMEANVDSDGKVVLNSRFLIDAIGAIDEDKLNFGFSGKLAPVVIRGAKDKDYTHIIMPLKS